MLIAKFIKILTKKQRDDILFLSISHIFFGRLRKRLETGAGGEIVAMTNVNLPHADDQIYLHVLHGEIIGVGGSFSDMTGYSCHDALGRDVFDVLKSLLKIYSSSLNILKADGITDGYIFTAQGQALDVTVSVKPDELHGDIYTIAEKPDTRIDDKLSVFEPLYQDEFMDVALYSVPDFIILKANKSFIRFLSRYSATHDDVVGSSTADYPIFRSQIEEILGGVLTTRKETHFQEKKIIGAGGRETYRNYTLQPVFEKGNLKFIVETSKDVTRHVLTRQTTEKQAIEIRQQKDRLEAVIETMHDALVIFDSTGQITFINARAREMYPHFSNETTVNDVHEGFTCYDLDNNEIPREKLPTKRVIQGETIRNERIIIKNSNWTQVTEVNATPIIDQSGKLVSAVVSHHDITVLYQNQQIIKSKNDLLNEKNMMFIRQNNMLDLSNEAIYAWDLSGPIVYWNKGAERMYGFSSSEAVGSLNKKLLNTKFYENPQNLISALLSKGVWHGDLEHVTKEGKHLIIESRVQLIMDKTGKKIVLETNRDITERKKMEDELRESEFNFRVASEGSGAGVFAFDFLKNKPYGSPQYMTILGLPADTVLQAERDFTFVNVHPEDRGRLSAAIQAANDPSGTGILALEYRIIRPDQSVRWVRARGQTHFAGQGENVHPYLAAGAIIDITEAKTMADEIQRNSEELTNIIESTDDYIWAVGRDGRMRFCNSAAKHHFIEYYGKDISVYDNFIDMLPEQLASSFGIETQHQMMEGKTQFDVRTPVAGKIVSYSINPVYLGGEFDEVTIFGKEITERLNAEREIMRLNASLESRVSERTAQLEITVSDLKNITLVLSHDLKSMLRGISLYASDILMNKNVTENAQKISKINHEMLLTIDGLMNYERSARSSILKEDVNIKKMIIAVFNELTSTTPSRPATLEFETGLPAVKVDKDAIRHVILNILSNALKFTKPLSPARIVVGCRAEDNFYVIYFKDNGIGFDMIYSDKIFGVFERLHSKNEYEGSGVGLSIVRNIVQRHGGQVWVESEPGIGTTINMSLPF